MTALLVFKFPTKTMCSSESVQNPAKTKSAFGFFCACIDYRAEGILALDSQIQRGNLLTTGYL